MGYTEGVGWQRRSESATDGEKVAIVERLGAQARTKPKKRKQSLQQQPIAIYMATATQEQLSRSVLVLSSFTSKFPY